MLQSVQLQAVNRTTLQHGFSRHKRFTSHKKNGCC